MKAGREFDWEEVGFEEIIEGGHVEDERDREGVKGFREDGFSPLLDHQDEGQTDQGGQNLHI